MATRTRKTPFPQQRVLVLRTVPKDGRTGQNQEFTWPLEVGAVVEAPDWSATRECGGGLHGWLYGAGDHTMAGEGVADPETLWLVVEVILAEIVDLDGKVKFPRCTIRFIGDRAGAAAYILENEPEARHHAVIGATLTVGDNQISTVGAFGTASAGYRGTASAGDGGTASAGDGGLLQVRWWDGKRERIVTGYVGEDGIKAGVLYRLNEQHQFERVEQREKAGVA